MCSATYVCIEKSLKNEKENMNVKDRSVFDAFMPQKTAQTFSIKMSAKKLNSLACKHEKLDQ